MFYSCKFRYLTLLRQNSIDLVGKTLRTNDNQDLGKIESVENEVIIIKRVLLTSF
jgi:hypothetical protein